MLLGFNGLLHGTCDMLSEIYREQSSEQNMHHQIQL